MKKILFALVALVCSMSMNAQVMKVMKGNVVVATYTADQADNVVFEEAQGSTTTGTAKRTGDIDVNWVQLWEDGPKFAEYNVGVTDGKAESYGGYYCWGSSIDKDSNSAYKNGGDALTGTDDTATNLWGSNWRMPTQEELEALLANCDVEWTAVNGVNGRKFTGKGDYASNSVFLPAAGFCSDGTVNNQGNSGFFWSSTPNGSDFAYSLDFGSSHYDQDVYDDYCGCGYSVRAVLVEKPESTTTGTAAATGIGNVGWVQLWADGPKFAEKNVGASSATDKGTRMPFTDAIKEGEEFTWGANWCTPSQGEMDELLKAATSAGSEKVTCRFTEKNGVYGFEFTGSTAGYESNSVFFPAQDGGSDFGSALYWSGTASGDEGRVMNLGYIFGGWDSRWYEYPQVYDCLVRPVLKN